VATRDQTDRGPDQQRRVELLPILAIVCHPLILFSVRVSGLPGTCDLPHT
jgi:hypothetical protein